MKDKVPMYSPSKIRELLFAKGKTQEWLAGRTGYTPEMISRYMNGKSTVSMKFAARAALVLEVPLSWLEEDKVAA